MQARRRMSQIFKLVSTEPDAKNSPNGCHWTAAQLERWPVSVRATRPCSRSHSLSVPPAEPAMTVRSAESNDTHSTAEVWPDRLMMALGLPIDHRFTFLSSPPVTITLPDWRPMCRQLTGPPCATNSSAGSGGAAMSASTACVAAGSRWAWLRPAAPHARGDSTMRGRWATGRPVGKGSGGCSRHFSARGRVAIAATNQQPSNENTIQLPPGCGR
eukprot:scaffold29934_cov103-Isochrysis_galbana.AAC.1